MSRRLNHDAYHDGLETTLAAHAIFEAAFKKSFFLNSAACIPVRLWI
jgi:hypothetical protein